MNTNIQLLRNTLPVFSMGVNSIRLFTCTVFKTTRETINSSWVERLKRIQTTTGSFMSVDEVILSDNYGAAGLYIIPYSSKEVHLNNIRRAVRDIQRNYPNSYIAIPNALAHAVLNVTFKTIIYSGDESPWSHNYFHVNGFAHELNETLFTLTTLVKSLTNRDKVTNEVVQKFYDLMAYNVKQGLGYQHFIEPGMNAPPDNKVIIDINKALDTDIDLDVVNPSDPTDRNEPFELFNRQTGGNLHYRVNVMTWNKLYVYANGQEGTVDKVLYDAISDDEQTHQHVVNFLFIKSSDFAVLGSGTVLQNAIFPSGNQPSLWHNNNWYCYIDTPCTAKLVFDQLRRHVGYIQKFRAPPQINT